MAARRSQCSAEPPHGRDAEDGARADAPPRQRKAAESRSVAGNEQLNDLRLLVGRRIRELRKERGIGLRRLAADSGVTSGFLSQVESGRVMPSIASLVSICAVLQVHVGDVFDAQGSRARLIRRAERIVYSYPESGVTDEVLTADPTYRLEVVHSYFGPKGSTGGQPYSHGSQVEAAIVLKGQLVIHLGAEEFTLRAGDALTFPGTLLHDVHNPLDRPAEAIWVYSPATY
jgi:transcriptional regulator with XRE-family HTH domain